MKQHSTAQHSTAQHSTPQNNTAQQDVTGIAMELLVRASKYM
jgi:hypothetical protein